MKIIGFHLVAEQGRPISSVMRLQKFVDLFRREEEW
jgi:hypothetical protein